MAHFLSVSNIVQLAIPISKIYILEVASTIAVLRLSMHEMMKRALTVLSMLMRALDAGPSCSLRRIIAYENRDERISFQFA